MNIKLFSAVGVAVLVSAPAMAAPSCLQIGQIYSWNAVNDKTLIVEDNWHQKWKLSLMAPCINLTFKERVGFQSIGGFGGLTCLSKGDNVIVRNPGFPQRCPITSIVAYTPQMEAADKAAAAARKAQQNP
ncbi:MAG TPA: DUF6491 family protein [Rhizomicrobium sp.]|nr:DUF6491 family protein [Rhizomicrobium sp.]